LALKQNDWKKLVSATSQFGRDLAVTVRAQGDRVALLGHNGGTVFRLSAPAQVEKEGQFALTVADLARATRGRVAEVTITRKGNTAVFKFGSFKAAFTVLNPDAEVQKLPKVEPNITLEREDLDVILKFLELGTAKFQQDVATLAVMARPTKKGTVFVLTDAFSGAQFRSPRKVEGEFENGSVQIPRMLLKLAQTLIAREDGKVPLLLTAKRVACVGDHGDFFQMPAIELMPVKDMPGRLKALKQVKPRVTFAVEAVALRQAVEDVHAVTGATTVDIMVKKGKAVLGAVGAQSKAQASVEAEAKKEKRFTVAVFSLLALTRPWPSGSKLQFRVHDNVVHVKGDEPDVQYLIPTA